MSGYMQYTDESVRLMVLEARDQKAQIKSIAEQTGMTEDEVKRIAYGARENAIPDKPKTRGNKTYKWRYYDDKIIERRKQGWSWKKISAEVAIPEATLTYHWRSALKDRAGIPEEPKSPEKEEEEMAESDIENDMENVPETAGVTPGDAPEETREPPEPMIGSVDGAELADDLKAVLSVLSWREAVISLRCDGGTNVVITRQRKEQGT